MAAPVIKSRNLNIIRNGVSVAKSKPINVLNETYGEKVLSKPAGIRAKPSVMHVKLL